MHISRRSFLRSMAAGAGGALLAGIPPVRGQNTNRPNILFILTDDQAYMDLGCAGNPILQTPNLDQLAEEGTLFTHAYAPTPICSPARATILTGTDTWTHGCYKLGQSIDPGLTHFAEVLNQTGYETFFTGKWHNDGKPSENGFSSGESIILGGMYSLEDGGQALPTVRDFGGENPREVHKISTEIIADSAVGFLKKQNRRSDPFMMYVSFTVPHDPWMPPPEYADLYPEESIPVPQNFMPRPMNNGEPFDYYSEWHGNNLRDELKMAYPRTPDGVRDVRRRYYGTITHTDHQVGRILKQLKKSGLDDNTLVVFTSDHGISLGAHGISGKQTMYEEGIRIPFIMRAPNMQRRSAKNDALVSLMDIYPTFCEAAGAEIPQEVEGTSLLPLYTGDAYQQRDEIFASFYPNYHQLNMRAIRTKEHKLVYHITTNEIELYDINRDPYELHNLADKEAYNQIKKELLDRLLAWRQQGDNNLK